MNLYWQFIWPQKKVTTGLSDRLKNGETAGITALFEMECTQVFKLTFQNFKWAFTIPFIIQHFHHIKLIMLQTATSSFKLACILNHNDSVGIVLLVDIYSKKYHLHNQKHHQYDQEISAVVVTLN